MEISSISNNTESYSNNINKDSGLDKEAFLKLMVAQLKYQNPLDPAKDNEFMTQTASFNTLEQMTNMNSKMLDLISSQRSLYASSLIGKKIEWAEVSDGEIVLRTGIVEKVIIDEECPILIADKRRIALDHIINVFEENRQEDSSDTESYKTAQDI